MKTEELRRYYDCYHSQRANEALSDVDLNLQFIESLEILKTGSKIIEVQRSL